MSDVHATSTDPSNPQLHEMILGAGCFWCVEAVFKELKGVHHVEPGYAGGDMQNPSYEQVCTGRTGHAEVIRLLYDPTMIGFEQLLEVFFHVHDPTTKNRQGADVGPQYRSVVFYHHEDEKKRAEAKLREVDQRDLWREPIVTTLEPVKNYATAENYHHDYYARHGGQPYCSMVIAPKVKKFRAVFAHLLKETTGSA